MFKCTKSWMVFKYYDDSLELDLLFLIKNAKQYF